MVVHELYEYIIAAPTGDIDSKGSLKANVFEAPS